MRSIKFSVVLRWHFEKRNRDILRSTDIVSCICTTTVSRIFSSSVMLFSAKLFYWQLQTCLHFSVKVWVFNSLMSCLLPSVYIYCYRFSIWAASWQNQQNCCAPSEDSDQPGHPPSLIRVFALRSMGAEDPSSLHADSEDSGQTGRIWVFARRTCHCNGFVMRRLISGKVGYILSRNVAITL